MLRRPKVKRYSLVSVISNKNGIVAWQIFENSINSTKMLVFFRDSLKLIHENPLFKSWKALITMDNAVIHKINALKELANNFRIPILFLPPYCCQLAPIEFVFSFTKRIVRSRVYTQGNSIYIS